MNEILDTGSNAKILIVDDDLITADSIKKSLEKYGFDVIGIAANSEEAIHFAKTGQPNLIFMDINLRGSKDGIETSEKIKEFTDVPVIFLTASSDTATIERAKKVGPFGYLIKPFENQELYAAIKMSLYKHSIEKRLIESEERFRSLYENSTMGLYRTTSDGKIILANHTLISMLGYSSFEELTSGNLEKESFHPSNESKTFIEQIEKSGEILGVEARWTKNDGTIVYIKESTKVIRDSKGKPLYYDGTIEDISEQKKADEKLKLSEEKFNRAFQLSPVALSIQNEENLFIEVNDAFLKMLEYKREEIIDRSGEELNLWVDENERITVQENYRINNAVKDFEFRFRKKSGKIGVGIISAEQITVQGKSAILTSALDITDRINAEATIRENERRYRTLFENSPVGIFEEDFSAVAEFFDKLRNSGVKDFKEHFDNHPKDVSACAALIKILDINETIQKIFGVNSKEEISRHLPDFFNSDSLLVFKQEMIELANGATTFNSETPIVSPSGKNKILELSLSVVPGCEKTLSKVLISITDISERKKAEEALKQSETKYRELFNDDLTGNYIVSVDGTLILGNPALAGIFGFNSVDELKELNAYKLYNKTADREQFLDKIRKMKRLENYEHELIRPDGKVISVIENAIGEFDEKGELLRVKGYMFDNTERKYAEDLLRESELRFKQVSENAHEWIWEVDKNGLYTYASPVIKEILGYEPEEIVGKKYFYDLFDQNEREKIKQLAFEVFDRKENFKELVNLNRHKDGRIIILSTCGVPILDSNNNLIGYRGVDVDITERKHAEVALYESEELFRSFVHNSSDVTMLSDKNGKVTYLSPQFEIVFGYPVSKFVNRAFSDIIHPDDIDKYKDAWGQVFMHGKELHEFEYRIIDGNNNLKWMSHSAIILNVNEKVLGIHNTIRDITGRKRDEEQLQLSQQRLSLHIQQTPLALVEFDIDGRVSDWNNAAVEIFGYSREEAIGQHWTFMVPKTLWGMLDGVWESLVTQKGSSRSSNENATKNGKIISCEWYNTPLINSLGQAIGVASLIMDITERKRAEEEIAILAHSLKSINECVSISDMEEKIIFVNESFLKTYGFSENELIGSHISLVRSANNKPGLVVEILPATLHGGWKGELWNKRKDGSEFPIYLSTIVINNKENKPLGLIGVATDITERKRAEKELLEQMDEISRFNKLMVGREGKMIELKKEVNALLEKERKPKKYYITEEQL